MATPPVALTPPPGQGPAPSPQGPQAPTSPVVASTAPATPSPIQGATNMGIAIVHALKAMSTAYPATAPHIRKVLEDMRPVMASVMTQGQPGEPAAPPTNG